MSEAPEITAANMELPREEPGQDALADIAAAPQSVATEDQMIEEAADQELDSFNADDVIRLRHYDVASLSSAASFGAVVPAALEANRSILLWTVERHGEFSLTNGGGTLENYFKELMGLGKDGEVGKDQDGDDDDLYLQLAEERQKEDAERRRREDDLRATRSEEEIDAMAWVGNPDEIWSLGKVSASRKQWLAGAKAARKKAEDDAALSDADKIHLERQLSDIEVAIKEHRYEDAAKLKQELPPEYQRIMEDAALQNTATKDAEVSPELSRDAASKISGTETSTTARTNILDDGASSSQPVAKSEPVTAAPPDMALVTDIELTEEFTEVASPSSATPTDAPEQAVAVASVVPKLDMKRDI